MDKPKKEELWFTPEDLKSHVDNMNSRAEREFNEKFERRLRGHIEVALSTGKPKH